MDGERLAELALGEDLHGNAPAPREPTGAHQFEGHLGAGVETVLQRGDVDRLRVGAERLEGHRLLHVGPAQLSHAHVDRHLPTLEVGPALGARARTGALLTATGGLSMTGAFAASHALARAPAPGCGREVVQAD